MPADLVRLAVEMYKAGVLLLKDRSDDGKGFVLKRDRHLDDPPRSPFFITMRPVVRKCGPRQMIAGALVGYTAEHGLEFDLLADVPTSMTPAVVTMSDILQMDMVTPRLDPKTYGEKDSVLGDFLSGQTALVVDDMRTDGDSKKTAVGALTAVGLRVNDVLVVIDREQGGAQELAEANLDLHRIYTMRGLLDIYLRENLVTQEDDREIRQYLDAEAA